MVQRPLVVPAPLRFAAAVLLALHATPFACAQAAAGLPQVRFNRDVRPLLADRCFHCHGPSQRGRKAKLRLDRADGPDGAYRVHDGSQAIHPGSLAKSAVWYRLTTDDAGDRMPPADSHKQPLSADELAVIRSWILQGARYEDHWAFVPPERPPAAISGDRRLGSNPIDRLVRYALAERDLQPTPRADRRTLIRRVTQDLTGLPPTRAEIRRFLADTAPGAYQRLVDDLLARPQYGEHMARYWLDLVRFADTNGIHHDHYRELSPYRDWVIRAFNRNLPYDRFVTDQLAGDLVADRTEDQLVASGFHRLHLIIDVGTALPEESLARNVIDRVTAFGTVFMGMTLGCAVCHDHKYDPIGQRDFYQLSAFFNNLDAPPETGGRRGDDFRRGLQRPYIQFATPQQEQALDEYDCEASLASDRLEELRLAERATEDAARKKELQAERAQVEKARREWQNERSELLAAIPAAMVMKERREVRPAHILVRGAYDNPGEQVPRDTPAFLPPLRKTGPVATRLDLARWLLAPDHPLTARVAVNRFWQQFFGVGLVKTSEDFGTQGEWPSHPELLDHLALSFVESGWDVKALVRRIVTSETYRQSSIAPRAAYERDPGNRWLARGSRFRMDSEMIRDQILATGGLLNPTLYGKSVKPPQPAGLWKAVTLPSSYPRTYQADTGPSIYRRSLYTFWKRGLPPPQMSLLNAPTREYCTVRRERTNTPLQALLLLNEREFLKAARQLAHRELRAAGRNRAARLAAVYETITSRLPDPQETGLLLAALRDLEAAYTDRAELAAALCDGVDLDGGPPAAELAAWTMLVSTIFNLDVTKTRQ